MVDADRENCWRILEGQIGRGYGARQLHILGWFLVQLEVAMSLKPIAVEIGVGDDVAISGELI